MLLTLLTFITLPILQELSIYLRWFLFGMNIDVNSQFMPKRERSEEQYGEQGLN